MNKKSRKLNQIFAAFDVKCKLQRLGKVEHKQIVYNYPTLYISPTPHAPQLESLTKTGLTFLIAKIYSFLSK